MTTRARNTDLNSAWSVGRNARIRGLEIHDANVELARRLGWKTRADFDNDLLDECERGWNHEDSLRFRN